MTFEDSELMGKGFFCAMSELDSYRGTTDLSICYDIGGYRLVSGLNEMYPSVLTDKSKAIFGAK